ncbi:MAG: 5-formyltetrahydrofolate cyclo-ligase [Desulfosoma sp.]
MEDAIIEALKGKLREQLRNARPAQTPGDLEPSEAGKIAERLRRLGAYRTARCVMVPPTAFYRQTALNILLDGKNLVYPSPGMHKGFFGVDPSKIPPAQKAAAASFRTPNAWARKVAHRSGEKRRIDMIVVPCVAASRDGGRLADGSGRGDLQVACLNALGWIHDETIVVGVVSPDRILETIPMKSTDIHVHWILTAQSLLKTTWNEPPRPPIAWERLDDKAVRRNDVLFFLRGEKNASFSCGVS